MPLSTRGGGDTSPGGAALPDPGPDVPPPPQGGPGATVSSQRYWREESTGAEGARRQFLFLAADSHINALHFEDPQDVRGYTAISWNLGNPHKKFAPPRPPPPVPPPPPPHKGASGQQLVRWEGLHRIVTEECPPVVAGGAGRLPKLPSRL